MSYRAAIQLAPHHLSGLENLAILLFQQRRHEEARLTLLEAIRLKPDDARKHQILGVILMQQNNLDEAGRVLTRAVELNPEDPDGHTHLGALLRQQGRLEASVESYAAACRLDPGQAVRHYNLGWALHAAQRHDEAAERYRAAIARQADFADAHANLGVVLRETGDIEAALQACRTALELAPNDAEIHTNLGHWLLLTGQFDEGWKEFEWRFGTPFSAPARQLTQPRWEGETCRDRVVLLHAEQGFGDVIQFCRYVPLVAARTRVVLEVPPSLLRLLSGLDGVEQIVAVGDPLPPFDLHCPLMSLPCVFGTRHDTIPARIPYLGAAPDRVAAWRERLADLPGRRVGLVWAGSPTANETLRTRSTTLDRFAPLGEVAGISFVSLQKGAAAAQSRTPPAGMVVHDWTVELTDFAETAALIEALDLVISIDTSVAHLAGALGKELWLLNRFNACWRWLLDRTDSPWYPTLRQFRQKQLGDWDGVMKDLRDALANFAR